MLQTENPDPSPEDRDKLSGLLGFAHGVLTARAKVQMTMGAGLGVFQEGDLQGLPGVHVDCDDGAWLKIDRQRETRCPEPADHVAVFMATRPADPARPPAMKSAIAIEVSIEDASDLEEGGLLKSENVRVIVEEGAELQNLVNVILHADDCLEMRRDFENYASGPWSDWAKLEKPIRKSISLYNDMFKLNASIHTAEATPPELVWGIGIGRWKRADQKIDMPLIEQLVDIEVEDGGAIAIRPRDLAPTLSLKPYLELDIDASPKLQRQLQSDLALITQGEVEISPFTTAWEPLLDAAASQLSSTGEHISRTRIDAGEPLPQVGEDLRIASTWAIFGRPRSHEARAQDLEALREQIDDADADVPTSILGFASAPPDGAEIDTSSWGIDNTVLAGAGQNTWAASSCAPNVNPSSASHEPSASPHNTTADNLVARQVHFFPLPFNGEQGKISDLIDNPRLHVATVSGPPGTGKSHSIANIISHQMATGKRVLVTARTPEAIAAVREKLPMSLQPLVISSVGTDRESAKLLQNAISKLSNEVVGLDIDASLTLKTTLEQRIVACDAEAQDSDLRLSEIARANLAPLHWKGERYAAMDLVEILAAEREAMGWFTDRPAKTPPAQLADVLARLSTSLPELAGDIAYAGANLPQPDDLPVTADLIAAHKTEVTWNNREIPDFSGAPQMARDSAEAETRARAVLAELQFCARIVAGMADGARKLTLVALRDTAPLDRAAIMSTQNFLARQDDLDAIADVRFSLDACDEDAFTTAVQRGAAGKKPVGFKLFGSALKEAVGSVLIRGTPPSDPSDWRIVHASCGLQRDKTAINETLDPLICAQIIPPVPRKPWEIARYLKDRQAETALALEVSELLTPVATVLRSLFPYGLDIDDLLVELDCAPAIFALEANLPHTRQPAGALTSLVATAGESSLPVFTALRDLAGAIGKPETDPHQIVELRGEITKELMRLAEVAPRLRELGADLQALVEAGAPEWAARLQRDPLDVASLISKDWLAAWSWAMMTERVLRIIELGNGDEHRAAKANAMRQRRKLFEDLIRTRTLLGLAKRMTPRIRQAMEAFTQAVSKIGAGKGKKAPRFIRAAQEAAKQASSAAPVWIMPEYKIPEQLPPTLGDFDLVILDEASQSDITALAALARGKKILIVGDEEQVSPTVVGIPVQKINALRAEFLEGLPNAALIDENASIFEITKRLHPESHVMLREHFRCVAPIIQFSTRFYNNALVPLRVPKASERFDPPLADVYIRGAIRRGKTNLLEARWIVDEIARLIRDPRHDRRDIGIISLIGAEQAERIGRMLVEDERIGTEQIKKRRIIYGDARTMQGQERSIVFLSMVATRGNVTSQSTKDAQQRFNVAMSRAKDRLYLVRSVSLEDLRSTDLKAQILMHFADPMPDGRARAGVESAELMDRCDSGFEREVLGRLLEANYRVRPQVKVGAFSIDLVVEGSEDRRLAIELDGDQFHGPEVWERDMARQAALERAGWTFWRVFGSQWNARKDFWWKDLTDTLTRMKIEPIGFAAMDERFTETILWDASEEGDCGKTRSDYEASPEASMADASDPSEATVEDETDQMRSAPAVSSAPASAGVRAAISRTAPAVTGHTEGGDIPPPRQKGHAPLAHAATGDEEDLFSRLAQSQNGHTAEGGNAIVGSRTRTPTNQPASPTVRIGSTVRLEKLSDSGGKMEITIVEEGHDPDRGIIGAHTPLGQALIDAEVGENVKYHAGAYLREVRILTIR